MKKIKKETEKNKFLLLLSKHWKAIVIVLAILFVVACIELMMGRSALGPDGKFGFWDGGIMSSENSQRVADPYSFTHIIHGLAFFLLIWIFARKLSLKYKFLLAVLIEAGWEILENSTWIIQRYREATIGLGYFGDSILNSVCDIVFMMFGFWFANKFPKWVSILLFIAIEIILLPMRILKIVKLIYYLSFTFL